MRCKQGVEAPKASNARSAGNVPALLLLVGITSQTLKLKTARPCSRAVFRRRARLDAYLSPRLRRSVLLCFISVGIVEFARIARCLVLREHFARFGAGFPPFVKIIGIKKHNNTIKKIYVTTFFT